MKNSSSKFASLLVLFIFFFIADVMTLTGTTPFIPPPTSCETDADCVPFCQSIRMTISHCDEESGHCTCSHHGRNGLRPLNH
ncbi:hypothetical protein LINPERHAP1_LOCUS40973 [Linum perenne]